MADSIKRTELSELGEFGFIKRLTQKIKLGNTSSVTGIGDDAAVLDYKEKQVVITTDMLVEGVHLDLTYAPLKHIGYKAASVNFSDIYAMNAHPKQILVSIAVSNRFSVEALEEVYEGIVLACNTHQVDLVGGDTTSSLSGLVISITAVGEAEKDEIVYRSGAEEHDLLCVSGDLGAAYLGLQILEREKQIFKDNPKIQPDLEGYDYILERQLKPEARKDIIQLLKEFNIKPSSMIDISDGLASEAIHICQSSNVGCSIYEEKIPIDPTAINTANKLNLDPTMCALSGGEDYELLFTIKQPDFEKIKDNPHFSVIGHITDKNAGAQLISKGGHQTELTAQGWDAFLTKEKE
ncbi:MAG: thiamine-phosphate kinase [Flavobacteriales bacterium]|nr:MAG: thiamine-phosphate kinase [Flavobacteriales bacterium]